MISDILVVVTRIVRSPGDGDVLVTASFALQ